MNKSEDKSKKSSKNLREKVNLECAKKFTMSRGTFGETRKYWESARCIFVGLKSG